MRVAGTTIGRDHRLWLVSALGFEIEIELAPRMVVLRYDDVPGADRRVGTLLGEAGANIANMALWSPRPARRSMVLSLDSPAAPRYWSASARAAGPCLYFVGNDPLTEKRQRAALRAARRSVGQRRELDQVGRGRTDQYGARLRRRPAT